jgi:hypothetical protein
MRIFTIISWWVLAAAVATHALGHGNPVDVSADDNLHLTIANGLPLGAGFARSAADADEDAALDFGPNQTLRSVYPGYNISGLSTAAPLQFEVLSRPDFAAPGHPMRWLWFWNDATQTVGDVPADAKFDVIPLFGSGSIQLRQSSLLSGPTLTMANPIGPFLGADQHLLIYQLQDQPSAKAGVYGIFARFVSPGLEASAPILLAFRYGVAVEAFAVGADAINQAAALPGDYDDDGDVDADDYNFWRGRFGNNVSAFTSPDGDGSASVDAADYVVWRDAFPASASSSLYLAVPEPVTLLPVAILTGCLVSRRRRVALSD